MQGELGIKVKELVIYGYGKKSNSNELRIIGEDGNTLYIVGDNDWIELFKNAKKQNFSNYYGKEVL